MIPRIKLEGMPFGKPASTPDQVRGMLFPERALPVLAPENVIGGVGDAAQAPRALA
jgi:hypothetical protein